MKQHCAPYTVRDSGISSYYDCSKGEAGNLRYFSNVRLDNEGHEDEFRLSNAKLESAPGDLTDMDWASMCSSAQEDDFEDGQRLHLSPEAEVTSWLHDEPMETSSVRDHHTSFPAVWVDGHCGRSGGSEGKMEIGGRPCLADELCPSRRALGLPEDSAAQQQGSSTPANLYAQLRSVKIKESVIRDGIRRLGGGRKGLGGLIKAILFWLEERNSHIAQSGDSCISQSDSLSVTPPLREADLLPWSNAEPRIVVDVQSGSVGNFNHAVPTAMNLMTNSSSSHRDDDGGLCDLTIGCNGRGSEEYCKARNCNNQSRIFIGEPERDGLIGGFGLHHKNISSLSLGDQVSRSRDDTLQGKIVNCARISSPNPSPDRSGLHIAHGVAAYDEYLSHPDKTHSPSPSTLTSSECSSVWPVTYGSRATPPVCAISEAPSILGSEEANPFAPGGPFSMKPSSPPLIDLHCPDFSCVHTHGSTLTDEMLDGGSSGYAYGCGLLERVGSVGYSVLPDNLADEKAFAAQLGALPKATPAACTRMARKKRMFKTRTVNRFTLETGARARGKSRRMWSSGSLPTSSQSQRVLASERQLSRRKDQRDHGHLQFVLQKLLRASDVGSLGRIVLPKKDAESNLPWLTTKEGIHFTGEDYDTGEKMQMRYRFWPNNKSRMYILENTGAFVKRHNLQEFDKIEIYKTLQQEIYVIRARRADFVDPLPTEAQSPETDGERKELGERSSSGDTCTSGASSCVDLDMATPESTARSSLERAPESVATVPDTRTSSRDLLPFEALLEDSMGNGTENLVRYPSLESLRVEFLELGLPATAKKDATSSVTGIIPAETSQNKCNSSIDSSSSSSPS